MASVDRLTLQDWACIPVGGHLSERWRKALVLHFQHGEEEQGAFSGAGTGK